MRCILEIWIVMGLVILNIEFMLFMFLYMWHICPSVRPSVRPSIRLRAAMKEPNIWCYSNALDLYSRGTLFESRPVYSLSCLRFTMVLFSSSGQLPG
jgi:hypothetical protein